MFLTFRLLPASSDVFLCPRRCPEGGRAAPVPRRPLQRPRCPVPDRPPRALGFAVAAPRCGPNACSCRLSTPGQPPSSLVAYRRGDTYRARNLHFGGTSAEGAPLAPLGIGSKSKATGHRRLALRPGTWCRPSAGALRGRPTGLRASSQGGGAGGGVRSTLEEAPLTAPRQVRGVRSVPLVSLEASPQSQPCSRRAALGRFWTAECF